MYSTIGIREFKLNLLGSEGNKEYYARHKKYYYERVIWIVFLSNLTGLKHSFLAFKKLFKNAYTLTKGILGHDSQINI